MKNWNENQSGQGLSPEELEQLFDEVAETLIPREGFKYELRTQLRQTYQGVTTEENTWHNRLAGALRLSWAKSSWKQLPPLIFQTALGVVMIVLVIVFWGQMRSWSPANNTTIAASRPLINTKPTTLPPTPIITSTPIVFAPPQRIADFESYQQLDWWSPDSEQFQMLETTEEVYQGEHAFKVSYQKTDTFQFVAAALPPENRDFSQHDLVSAWVFGEVSLLLKLEDIAGNQADVSTEKATNSNGWSQLQFDYSTLEDQLDLTSITQFFFFPAPGDSQAVGTFYLDNLQLTNPGVAPQDTIQINPVSPQTVLLDFESGPSGIWWSPDETVFTYAMTQTIVYSEDSSFYISYQKSDTFQFLAWEVPDERQDFSDASVVEIWVYGQVNLLLKLEDAAGNQAEIGEQFATNKEGWSRLRFNYADLGDQIDLTQVHQLFFFPSPGDPGAARAFYLDEISLSD